MLIWTIITVISVILAGFVGYVIGYQRALGDALGMLRKYAETEKGNIK